MTTPKSISVPHRPWMWPAFIGLFFLLQHAQADTLYINATTFFLSRDSMLEKTATQLSAINTLNGTDSLFLEIVAAYPEIGYLMRVNSQGKIISKVSHGMVFPRTYRSIGNQSWYKQIALHQREYYGSLSGKSGTFLFWARPLPVTTRQGTKFGGALVAQINLARCFELIAEETGGAFEIADTRQTIFSNLQNSADGPFQIMQLGVYGTEELSMRFQSPPEIPTAAAAGKEDLVSTGAMTGEKHTAAPLPAVTDKDDGKKNGAISPAAIFFVFFFCAAVVAVCVYAIQRAADNNFALLQDVDKRNV